MSHSKPIEAADFAFLSDLIRQEAGIVLTKDQEYLVQSRMRKVLQEMRMQDMDQLMRQLRSLSRGHVLNKIYDAITINETAFYRDGHVFEILKNQLLPELAQRATNRPLRVWSAAASTGQEAYSLAIILQEMGVSRFDIQGTDLSQDAIERARNATYSSFEIQRGLPPSAQQRYFKQLPDQSWKLESPIAKSVQFRQHNLLYSASQLGTFDLILCRNVLIYFDNATKQRVLKHLRNSLSEHGYLVLGSTESLIGFEAPFRPVKNLPAIYERA